ncbi:MAG: GH3 family acyl-acid amido synthetase [Planctomycetota bacterium]|jgi:hypothetical protein
MGFLLKTVMRVKGGAIRRSSDGAAKDPEAAQTKLLMDIVRRNRNTAYGREHAFSGVTDGASFARAVPVNTYAQLEPYVERMKGGLRNVLTADQPFMFNMTSGTTDRPKLLPITRRGQALTSRVSREWLNRALQDHPSFLDRQSLIVCSSPVEGWTRSGIPYGSASGMIYKNLPRMLRRSFVLPFILSEIGDYDLRYFLMARLALESDLSFVATPNPTTLMRIAETGIRHQDDIVRSVLSSAGTVGSCPPRAGGT